MEMAARNTLVGIVTCVVCFCTLRSIEAGSVEVAMTPEQLVRLVLAGKAKYRSIDTTFTISRYASRDGVRKGNKPEAIVDAVWRSTDTRQYSRMTTVSRTPTGESEKTIDSLAFAPTALKQLHEEANQRPTGIVTRDPSLRSLLNGAPPTLARWQPYGETAWSQIVDGNSDVSQDPDTGLLHLSSRFIGEGSSYEVIIDPHKGYLPVRTVIRHSGKLVFWCEVKRWELVDALWLPMEYTMGDRWETECDYVVKKARINIEIPSEELDLVFPSRTRVWDQIANLRYAVDSDLDRADERLPQMNTQRGSGLPNPKSLLTTRPVSDKELEMAASRVDGVREKALGSSWAPFLVAVGGSLCGAIAVTCIRRRQSRNRERGKTAQE